MRRRVTVVGSVCVCVSVCLSVKSHLTSGASVRPENTVTYSAGNGGQNICGVFFETAPFKSYGVKRKRKSQYASLLWLTRDQVFLFEGIVSMTEPTLSFNRTCLSSIRARALYMRFTACAFKDSRTHGRRGFCTLVH